jgi:hypothetical protein
MNINDDGIAIKSMGAVPEKHADRVVAEMLRAIVRARGSMYDQVWATVNSGPDGNPRAQAKMAEQLWAAGGELLCYVSLDPGKRGRYELFVVVVEGWDLGRRSIIASGDVIPERPWLAGTLIEIVGRGRGRYDQTSKVAFFITHHALSRLVQCSGVRTSSQLLSATRSMFAACFFELSEHRWSFPDGKRVTFDLCDGGNAIAVLNNNVDGKHGGVMVVTVL